MKAGVISLVKTLALELGASGITVNCLCPTTIDTPMVHNRPCTGFSRPTSTSPTRDTVRHRYEAMNPMRVAWLDPQEIADVDGLPGVRRRPAHLRRGVRDQRRRERQPALGSD